MDADDSGVSVYPASRPPDGGNGGHWWFCCRWMDFSGKDEVCSGGPYPNDGIGFMLLVNGCTESAQDQSAGGYHSRN
jgi:hypothetical protein